MCMCACVYSSYAREGTVYVVCVSHISCPYSVTLIYSNTYSIFIDSLHRVRVCVLSQLATGRNSSAVCCTPGFAPSVGQSLSFVWRRVKWSTEPVEPTGEQINKIKKPESTSTADRQHCLQLNHSPAFFFEPVNLARAKANSWSEHVGEFRCKYVTQRQSITEIRSSGKANSKNFKVAQV